MEDIGVRFRVDDAGRFDSLRQLFYEIKKDNDAEEFRDGEKWSELVPDSVKSRFSWPSADEREDWLERRPHTVIAVPEPSQQVGVTWDFYRVFESIEESEYSLRSCEMTEADVAEFHIEPWAYPYGSVGAFIALVEAYGFTVLGVNECGKYESREELLKARSE